MSSRFTKRKNRDYWLVPLINNLLPIKIGLKFKIARGQWDMIGERTASGRRLKP